MKKLMVAIVYMNTAIISKAQTSNDTTRKWTNHFQLTVISQSHLGFKAPYSGAHSLSDTVETGATSMTATLFLGRKLWKGASVYVNPEISGGRGLSYAVGVAGALNGETYRVGNPTPLVFLARAYLQQDIALSNTAYEVVEDDINRVSTKVATSRITIIAGKFSLSDYYDNNSYSHDPRSQFINWSIMSNGAWDYPANTRGYTKGIVVALVKPTWSVRLSTVEVPAIANAPKLEYDISKAHSETLEVEKKTSIGKKLGIVRVLFTNTYSKAPSYAAGIKALSTGDQTTLGVIAGANEGIVYGGRKYGFGLSAEQAISDNLGAFARVGWNDGKDVTWAFTEIDRTAHAGLSLKGSLWKRNEDVFAIAGVVNGISQVHRNFLSLGGYGFIIGDGKLNYGNESIFEAYYNARLSNFFWLSLDYQFVTHPAYNKDRGPVNVFAVRGHIQL